MHCTDQVMNIDALTTLIKALDVRTGLYMQLKYNRVSARLLHTTGLTTLLQPMQLLTQFYTRVLKRSQAGCLPVMLPVIIAFSNPGMIPGPSFIQIN